MEITILEADVLKNAAAFQSEGQIAELSDLQLTLVGGGVTEPLLG